MGLRSTDMALFVNCIATSFFIFYKLIFERDTGISIKALFIAATPPFILIGEKQPGLFSPYFTY